MNKRKIHTNVEMERQTERAQIKAGERGLKLKKKVEEMREAEVERERQGETERVGGRFSQRGGSTRGGEER